MSETTLNILDATRTIHGHVHASTADHLVAALAADPTTIEELALAFGRFEQPVEGRAVLGGFRNGFDRESWDAGIVCIDLIGRAVSCESTYSCMGHRGEEDWHDGTSCTQIRLPFRLAEDWLFTDDVKQFEMHSKRRRAERREPLDERAVIYGKLPEFIVRQVHDRQSEFAADDGDARYELVRSIHVNWMMTPRDDLDGKSPRDVMIDARHSHIQWDVQNQSTHWSFVRQAPPGIPRDSHAYRFGGFGTTELVLYYDLTRELICECLERASSSRFTEDRLPAEAEHLQKRRQDWLHDSNTELTHRRTPAGLIDLERRRLPIKCTDDEAIVDPDCPCCQSLANEEEFGPTFMFYDGSSMDDDFAFSFHRTRDEWEAEQRQYEQYNREFEERWRNRESQAADEVDTGDDVPF
jgi:hypothetical protein